LSHYVISLTHGDMKKIKVGRSCNPVDGFFPLTYC
jgi:hypothetical protein